MSVVQAAPVIAHLTSNALVDEKFIGLALILFSVDQGFVLEAVVLDIGTRDDVIDLVQAGVIELIDVDWPARI